eukprot:3527352-Rhodomonas_salina.3
MWRKLRDRNDDVAVVEQTACNSGPLIPGHDLKHLPPRRKTKPKVRSPDTPSKHSTPKRRWGRGYGEEGRAETAEEERLVFAV